MFTRGATFFFSELRSLSSANFAARVTVRRVKGATFEFKGEEEKKKEFAMTDRDCLFDSLPKERLASGRLKGNDTVVEEVQNNIREGKKYVQKDASEVNTYEIAQLSRASGRRQPSHALRWKEQVRQRGRKLTGEEAETERKMAGVDVYNFG